MGSSGNTELLYTLLYTPRNHTTQQPEVTSSLSSVLQSAYTTGRSSSELAWLRQAAVSLLP